jgi:hypothetical protein
VHSQPTDGDVVEKIDCSAYSLDEVRYLLKHALDGTDEIPFNTPKKVQDATVRREKVFYFEKFELRLTLPNNIVALKDGRHLACTDFGSTSDGDMWVEGRVAVFPRSVYSCPGYDSVEVGFCECRGFSEETRRVWAHEIAAKTMISPKIKNDFDLSELFADAEIKKKCGGLNLNNHGEWYLANLLP